MAISRPPAKPWGDPTEAVRSLVRQLAAAGEPDVDEGVGTAAGVPARGWAVAVCVGWAAGLEPEHAPAVTPIAARMAIRNGFIFADPFRSSALPDPSHPVATANGSALMIITPRAAADLAGWPSLRWRTRQRATHYQRQRHVRQGSQAPPARLRGGPNRLRSSLFP